jgi:hypothetical protein
LTIRQETSGRGLNAKEIDLPSWDTTTRCAEQVAGLKLLNSLTVAHHLGWRYQRALTGQQFQ